LRRVVRRDPLHRRQRVLAGNLDLTHVADVEEPGSRPYGHVLLRDAGVLDRHVPAGEWHHPRAGCAMSGVERRFLERSFGGLLHGGAGVVSETGNGTMPVLSWSRIVRA